MKTNFLTVMIYFKEPSRLLEGKRLFQVTRSDTLLLHTQYVITKNNERYVSNISLPIFVK